MLNVVLIQSLGLIGWLFLLTSYWHKDLNKILIFHLISGIFYIFHYFFIGAIEGIFIVVLEVIRDYSYYKTSLDKSIFFGTIPIYLIFTFFTYDGLISLFPTIASLIDGYSLAINRNVAVIGAIISEILWLIYDAIVGSYIGIITGLIMIISNIIVIITSKKEKS